MDQSSLSQQLSPSVQSSPAAGAAQVAMLFSADGRPAGLPPRAVRRLLRHRLTRQYVGVAGWTFDPQEAREFTDAVEAAQVCAQQGLIDMELTLRIGSGTCDLFSTPIR